MINAENYQWTYREINSNPGLIGRILCGIGLHKYSEREIHACENPLGKVQFQAGLIYKCCRGRIVIMRNSGKRCQQS